MSHIFYPVILDVYVYLGANPFRPYQWEATDEDQAGYDSRSVRIQIGDDSSQWAQKNLQAQAYQKGNPVHSPLPIYSRPI